MVKVHYAVSGILLLTLLLSVGFVGAAAGDANLSVSKVARSAAFNETTWVVTLANNGPADATNISLAESISGFSGLVEMSGVADLGTYDNTTRLWNISRLDNGTSTHLTVFTVFDTEGTQTNTVDILGLDQTSYGNSHADAAVVLNRAAVVVIDQPLTVNLTIRPDTLNLKSKGVFTVFVTLDGISSGNKPRIDFAASSLSCGDADLISAGVSNKDGGTLVAKFHRQDLEAVTRGAGVQINCSGTLSVSGEPVGVEGSDTIRVIGEKEGLDKILSDFRKYLGLEQDESAVNETEEENITVSVTLNPDTFRNNGQMKKAIRTTESNAGEQTGNGQNVSLNTGGQNQNTLKTNGNGKNSSGNNAGNSADKGNKNTNKDDNASNGKKNN